MLRGSILLVAVLTAVLIQSAWSQPVVKLLGLTCAQDTLYEIDSALQCCSEDNIAPTPMADATACAVYCATNNLPSIYGRYLDGVYFECVCLTNCQSVSNLFSLSGYVYTPNSVPSSTVQDLASGATVADVEKDIQPNSLSQISISSTQAATFHTSSDSNGNVMQFLATVTAAGLPAGAELGFTLRNMMSYSTYPILKLDYVAVNNSFEVMAAMSVYDPPTQYKRQAADLFTYSMFHQGSGLVVVLSLNNQPVLSWEYTVMITNLDSTTAQSSIVNNLVFDLALGYTTALNYAVCQANECLDFSTLQVCNGSYIDKRYCYFGCDYQTKDCVPCDVNNCQGTCVNSPTPKCVCNTYQIGSDCSLDISRTFLALEGYYDIAEVTIDINNCQFGTTCVKAHFFTPTTSQGLDKFCCSTEFALSSITRLNGSDVLNFTATTNWDCGLNNNNVASRFPSVLSLQWLDFLGVTVITWTDDIESQLRNSSDSGHVTSCDQVSTATDTSIQTISSLSVPVGVAFMAASCAAVIVGFAVGSVTVSNGMTVKRREPLAKGCIPKYNGDLANSVVATCVLDVALVTGFGIIGTYYPISLLIFASGILLVIMTYQIQHAGKRFGNVPRTVHHLLTVQKVFGRIAGAFLIVLGLTIFLIALSAFVLGQLIVIVAYVGPVLPWLLIAVYATWALVIVHFAAAIYVSVCFYFTAVRSRDQDQESVRVHTVELDEPSSDYIA